MFFFLTYGKAENDRGEKHTQVFTKAPEAGTHHILSWVIGHSSLMRQCYSTTAARTHPATSS